MDDINEAINKQEVTYEITDAIHTESITFQPAVIEWPEYEQVLEQAKKVAEQLETVEVTEDNVKESKRLVAALNKDVNRLETFRKEVKGRILEPYSALERQVKEIVGIVKEADTLVRSQVYELEEQERRQKRADLYDLFHTRAYAYEDVIDFIDFDKWLTPQHLNKSVSMNKCEQSMVEYMEGVKEDVALAKTLSDSEEILTEFLLQGNIKVAIQAVADRRVAEQIVADRKKALETVKAIGAEDRPGTNDSADTDDAVAPTSTEGASITRSQGQAAFIIYGSKNIELIRMFIEKHDIDFEEVDV